MKKITFKNMHIYALYRCNELDHEKGRPAILLNYKRYKSLIWAGTHNQDIKTKEKPLLLILNNIKTYFYASGINSVYTNNLISAWINFEYNCCYKLNLVEQELLITKFITFTLLPSPYLELNKLQNQINQLLKLIKDLQNKKVL